MLAPGRVRVLDLSIVVLSKEEWRETTPAFEQQANNQRHDNNGSMIITTTPTCQVPAKCACAERFDHLSSSNSTPSNLPLP